MRYPISTGTVDLTLQCRYIRAIHIRESAGTPAAFKISIANGSGGAAYIIQGAASGTYDVTFATPLFFPAGAYIINLTGAWTGEIEGY